MEEKQKIENLWIIIIESKINDTSTRYKTTNRSYILCDVDMAAKISFKKDEIKKKILDKYSDPCSSERKYEVIDVMIDLITPYSYDSKTLEMKSFMNSRKESEFEPEVVEIHKALVDLCKTKK